MYQLDDDGGHSRWRKLFTYAIVIALAAVGWFVVRPRLVEGDSSSGPLFDPATPTTQPATTEPAETTEAATTVVATTTSSTTVVATSSTTVVATTGSTTPAPATTALSGAARGPYASLPDGSPVPVVVILDDERVGLSGALPSQHAIDTLNALVTDINEFPDAPVNEQLTVDPNIPVSVGVRFLELKSALFPEVSAELLPDHARQLDRIVAMMSASPNLTAAIVGHADQRGTDQENLLLSRRRAESIVAYLVDHGIDGARLSARAVGEEDLLSVNDDAASLALNRRSELILYGLFVPATPPPSSAAATTTTTG